MGGLVEGRISTERAGRVVNEFLGGFLVILLSCTSAY